MNALLVWPRFSSFSFWNFEKVCEVVGVKYMTPPLGLLTVAALLPDDWKLRVVDENVSPIEDEDFEWAEFVMVSSKIVHRPRALEVVRMARERGLPVAVGGPDPSMSPDRYRRAGANYLCLDEGEVTVPMMLADVAHGATGGCYRADRPAEMQKSPVPRFDLVDHRDYLYMGVQYSRGCPYNCEFCNVIDLFHGFRTKTIEQTLAEFELLYRLGYRGQVDFFDDNFIGHMNDVKPFLTGVAAWLKKRNYPFQLSTALTLNIAKDPELLDLLREARFKYLLVGIETPNTEALNRAQKPQNTGFSIAEAADAIYRRAGATIHSGFLLGMDGEPHDIGDHMVRCIDEACIPWVMAGVVYPLPGTQLAKRLDREGRLFPKAREDIDLEKARDQVSAGLMFKPERPAKDILRDLVRVMEHSFDPVLYLKRCADVAVRLNTASRLAPSLRLFFRNARTFFRLVVAMTRSRRTRLPFWKALLRVATRNPAGIESLCTLSVLFLHFDSMVPYCFEQLRLQRATLDELGEEEWLARNLRGDAGPAAAARPAPHVELPLDRALA